MKNENKVCRLVICFLLTGLIVLVGLMTFYKINTNRSVKLENQNKLSMMDNNTYLMGYKTSKIHMQDVYSSLHIAHSYFHMADLNVVPEKGSEILVKDLDHNRELMVFLDAWFLGNIPLNNDDVLLDAISEQAGSDVTIYQKTEKGFVSVSSSLTLGKQEREIGYLIVNNSGIAKAVNEGNTFIEKVQSGDKTYINAYEPIIQQGVLIGILSVRIDIENAAEYKVI